VYAKLPPGLAASRSGYGEEKKRARAISDPARSPGRGVTVRVLTWHVHGSYLYYLAQVPHRFYVPTRAGRPEGYGGRAGSHLWPDNLIEVAAEEVPELKLDLVLYQSRRNWEVDRFELLSEQQRSLPRIFLEHDPPRETPTDTRHPVADPGTTIVHVTAFNELMWDAGPTPTMVVDHGVMVPATARYTGELERGLVIVNDLPRRGRRLGRDVFEEVREQLPLDLVGMRSQELGGLGEIPPNEMAEFASRYRFLFNPIRYTSLGLAVLESMMVGLPVVALATTEYVTAVQNGVSGYVDTSVPRLIGHMKRLLADPEEARRLGEGARRQAETRFSIERFKKDWDAAITAVASGAQDSDGRQLTSSAGGRP
jgi:glycosyltransferase involved in cell wall biosynthesis